MIIQVVLTVFYFLLFNFLIYRFKQLQLKNFKPFVTSLLFNLKFITGILIWVIYTFYYKDVQNNDVHKFYNDALILRNAVTENPAAFTQLITGLNTGSYTDAYTSQMKNWARNFDEAPFNEKRTIIKLNALIMFVSFKTYFVHILFMCFFSLIGWVLLTNAILAFTDLQASLLVLPILLLPSVLFWTSGVMKEPLLVLGLGLVLHGLLVSGLKVVERFITIVIGVIIILMTKFFVIACLLPALISFYIFKNKQTFSFIIVKYLVVNFILLLVAFNIHYVIPKINLQQMLVNKQSHSVKEAAYFNAGSRIDIPPIDGNTLSILKVAPVGIWNTITRPYLWEGKNMMMLASAVENIFTVLFIILCLSLTNFKSIKNLNLVLFLLTFSISYYALIGICTPVLGNLVRYKAPLLPIFLFAFILNVQVTNPSKKSLLLFR